jgi:hypothetical protein
VEDVPDSRRELPLDDYQVSECAEVFEDELIAFVRGRLHRLISNLS